VEIEYNPIPVDYEPASQAALDGLSANGADLSKPTELAFYLYFPRLSLAESFADCLRDEGFRADVYPPLKRLNTGSTKMRWSVVLRLNSRPEREFIDSISAS
jgi:hypothetical protein